MWNAPEISIQFPTALNIVMKNGMYVTLTLTHWLWITGPLCGESRGNGLSSQEAIHSNVGCFCAVDLNKLLNNSWDFNDLRCLKFYVTSLKLVDHEQPFRVNFKDWSLSKCRTLMYFTLKYDKALCISKSFQFNFQFKSLLLLPIYISNWQ